MENTLGSAAAGTVAMPAGWAVLDSMERDLLRAYNTMGRTGRQALLGYARRLAGIPGPHHEAR